MSKNYKNLDLTILSKRFSEISEIENLKIFICGKECYFDSDEYGLHHYLVTEDGFVYLVSNLDERILEILEKFIPAFESCDIEVLREVVSNE